jgi:hypothetical protein
MIPLGFEEGETFPIGYDFMTVQGGVQVCYVSTWAHTSGGALVNWHDTGRGRAW